MTAKETWLTMIGVGVGLVLMVGAVRLELDDEIQTHVPTFPRKQSPVTLRQLMGPVSGVRQAFAEHPKP